jgi:hypothetical protein
MSASTIQQINQLFAKMKANGWLVEGAEKDRDPVEALEIENRWLRRRIARLEKRLITQGQPHDEA